MTALALTLRPVAALRDAAKILRPLGWRLLDVSVNETSGFVRIVAEARDWSRREGVQVLLQRSSFDSVVLEYRHRVVLRDGMYTAEWEVAEWLGRRRFADISSAAREMLHYACDNNALGALGPMEAAAREAQLAPLLARLAPAFGS